MICTCMYTYVYVHIYVYMNMYVYIYIYIHTNIYEGMTPFRKLCLISFSSLSTPRGFKNSVLRIWIFFSPPKVGGRSADSRTGVEKQNRQETCYNAKSARSHHSMLQALEHNSFIRATRKFSDGDSPCNSSCDVPCLSPRPSLLHPLHAHGTPLHAHGTAMCVRAGREREIHEREDNKERSASHPSIRCSLWRWLVRAKCAGMPRNAAVLTDIEKGHY